MRTLRGRVLPQRGSSLLEALIAVLLSCFCVLALVRLQLNLVVAGSSSQSRTQAQLLGREVLSRIATSATPSTFPAGSDSTTALNTSYLRTWTVSAGPAGEATGNVVVRWTDARGATDFVSLSSIVAKDVASNEGMLLQARGDYGFANAGAGTLGVPGRAGRSAPWTSTAAALLLSPTPPLVPLPTPPLTSNRSVSGSILLTGAGKIAYVSVAGTAGATCSLSGSGYSCSVPISWTGTVAISSTNNQTVSPASRTYTNVVADVLAQDFTVFK